MADDPAAFAALCANIALDAGPGVAGAITAWSRQREAAYGAVLQRCLSAAAGRSAH
jgi:hypothetical protein